MRKEERFLSLASAIAHKSMMHHKHGSILVYHGKPVSVGYNSTRNYSKDNVIQKCYTCHSEIDAIRNATKVVHRS
jgi:deoxycytidylate deaminase